MTKNDKKVLKFFCDRVDCVVNSRAAPLPAQNITKKEVIGALYIIAKELIKKKSDTNTVACVCDQE